MRLPMDEAFNLELTEANTFRQSVNFSVRADVIAQGNQFRKFVEQLDFLSVKVVAIVIGPLIAFFVEGGIVFFFAGRKTYNVIPNNTYLAKMSATTMAPSSPNTKEQTWLTGLRNGNEEGLERIFQHSSHPRPRPRKRKYGYCSPPLPYPL